MAEQTFKDQKFNFKRLIAFGFHVTDETYTYRTTIVDNQFLMTVTVTAPDRLTTHVTDIATNDEYVLHLAPAAHGKFVGRVASAYQDVLEHIETSCMDQHVFKAPQVQTVLTHVQKNYGNQLEFLWPKFPQNAVLRRADTRKWYAVLITVQKNKLGLDSDEEVTVLDLRAAPTDITRLVDHQRYFPGYHMNKQHWLTIILDGTTPMDTIAVRLRISHQLAK